MTQRTGCFVLVSICISMALFAGTLATMADSRQQEKPDIARRIIGKWLDVDTGGTMTFLKDHSLTMYIKHTDIEGQKQFPGRWKVLDNGQLELLVSMPPINGVPQAYVMAMTVQFSDDLMIWIDEKGARTRLKKAESWWSGFTKQGNNH